MVCTCVGPSSRIVKVREQKPKTAVSEAEMRVFHRRMGNAALSDVFHGILTASEWDPS